MVYLEVKHSEVTKTAGFRGPLREICTELCQLCDEKINGSMVKHPCDTHAGISKNRGTPKMDGLYWKTLLKWMIWEETHYFRKHPMEKKPCVFPSSSFVSLNPTQIKQPSPSLNGVENLPRPIGSFLRNKRLCGGKNGSETPGDLPWPIGSMYGIFTYIWLIFMVNVGKYTMHGSYGW